MNEARFNQVRIYEDEPGADTGKIDHFRRPIVHSVSIVRVGDDQVLGRYRETETVLDTKEHKNPKTGAVTMRQQEVEISGKDAALRACKVNGWVLARN